jgi:hypothetical protein
MADDIPKPARGACTSWKHQVGTSYSAAVAQAFAGFCPEKPLMPKERPPAFVLACGKCCNVAFLLFIPTLPDRIAFLCLCQCFI